MKKTNFSKLILVSFCCMLQAIQLYGQGWEKAYGGIYNETGNSVQQTSDSGFIVAGNTNSFGAGASDIYLVKTNSNGDTMWTKTFGGIYTEKGSSASQTYDGGYIIAGETSSFGQGGEDIYVIKTNANGTANWTITLGTNQQESCGAIIQTSDSGFCVVGNTGNISGGNADVYLARLNALGDTLWTKTYGGNYIDIGYSLRQTIDGGFIISGATYNSLSGEYDALLIKTDINGDTTWTKSFNGSDHTYGNSVIQTTDSGYMIGGTAAENFWAMKTDKNGNTQWSKEVNKDGLNRCSSIIQTNDEGFVMAGLTNIFTYTDALIIKLDNQGNELWSKRYGGIMTDEASMIQLLMGGGFIIAGSTESFGAGSSDIYLIKTNCENFPTVNIAVLDTFCQGDTLSATLTTIPQTGAIYQWMFNDSNINGAVSSNNIASADGYYQLLITDSNGCNNLSDKLYIALPNAYFQVYPQEVCPGDNVTMTNTNWSPDTYPYYDWDFGDGTQDTGMTAIHAYQDTGTYIITRWVRMSNGSCNSYIDSVIVSSTALPPVDFDMLVNSMNMLNTVACPGDIIEFIPYAYTYLFVRPPAFEASSYLWDFGDGTSDTIPFPVHSYVNYGMYNITLTVTNHCGNSNSISQSITVDSTANPSADFSWKDTNGQINDTVQTCEQINFYSGSGISYNWNFGDGTSLTTIIDSIVHGYATTGVYNIELIATNGCGKTDTVHKDITVTGTCNSINNPRQGSESRVLVYPNPFSYFATFTISPSTKKHQPKQSILKIYNLQGIVIKQFIFDGSGITINRETFASGMYFYKLSNETEEIGSGKIIIQ